MGILDIFKRKDELDDFELPKEPESSYEFGSSGQDHTPTMPGPVNQQYQDPYAQQHGYGNRDQIVAKELEIISSKLDSIRATLESLNQRIAGLERVAYGDNYGRRY
ncbi:MAG: hypothetical protein ACMXYM_04060 [Candidatus Woesearchaeota archaeon]